MKYLVTLTFMFLLMSTLSTSDPTVATPTIQQDQDLLNNFLSDSQDTGNTIVSMDMAYFKGKSLILLNNHITILDSTLQSEISDFILSVRNPDGGYGNWKGAPSSMESTFQAITILNDLDLLSELSVSELTASWEFVQSLYTPSGGYFPLPDWDAPDITSTFRAIEIYQILSALTPGLTPVVQKSLNYTISNFIPPFFINGGSGYSEVLGGSPELIASSYSYRIFSYFDYDDPNIDSVVQFLTSLISSDGGISNSVNDLSTVGYTLRGLDLYYHLTNVNNATLPSVAESVLVANIHSFLSKLKETGFGFASTTRDTTSELSSTMFALQILNITRTLGYIAPQLDFTDTFVFVRDGHQPSYGIGNYPGDSPNLEYINSALKLTRFLNDSNWLKQGLLDFVLGAYHIRGAFGFRPDAQTRVKYTYFGIQILRILGHSMSFKQDIINYLLSAQNPDSGFGEQPGSQLSYLTHTYWAIEGLHLLGYDFSPSQQTDIIEFLNFFRKADGTYSNYPGFNSTITSTYRAYKILASFGVEIPSTDPVYSSLLNFQDEEGGFFLSSSSTAPSMDATYHAILLSNLLNIPLNRTTVSNFVKALSNNDGGYGPRKSFSSRMDATQQALSLLKNINGNTGEALEPDYFAPIIQPSFNERFETNKTIIGSYILSSRSTEAEGIVVESWIEVNWYTADGTQFLVFTGTFDPDTDLWTYIIGPFYKQGLIEFRFASQDLEGNIGYTDWYYLQSSDSATSLSSKTDYSIFLWVIPITFLAIASVEGITHIRSEDDLGGIQMTIQNKNSNNSPIYTFNTLYLILLISVLAFLARTFMGDAILVLEESLFLFRFVVAALFILFIRYIVGLRTFGFFGTSVIAFAWIDIGPIWGPVIFINVFALCYLIRKLIDPYNLSVGFRVGLVMVTAVMVLTVFEIIGEIYQISFLSSSVLLPIIITPWISDRYVQEEQEQSSLEAFTRLSLTLLVVFVAFLIMSIDAFVRFIILTPELWVLIFATMLYLGRTQTFTIMDKRRFYRLFNKTDYPLTLTIRNRDYIAKYNQNMLFPLINKFDLKEQFDKWEVPAAKLYGIVSVEGEIEKMVQRLQTEDIFKQGFVIKPSQSFGGRGIQVIKQRSPDSNFIIGDQTYHPDALVTHIRRIIRGEFMTSQTIGNNDIVLIEELILPDEKFGSLGIGLSDIRVIVFRGISVMCMARIPTHESGGLANLKQGAIGGAILIKNGVLHRAEFKQHELSIHPDTKQRLVGFRFEKWKKILAVASLAQKSTGLGYAGVDLVLDSNDEPQVLEVNKRPGLEIQNINLSSLLDRLRYIEENDIDASQLSPLAAASLSMKLASTVWEVNQ